MIDVAKLVRDAGWSGLYIQWSEPTGKPDCGQIQQFSDGDYVLYSDHLAAMAALREENERLREALQAIVDRWDTPLWKDAPHTGEFINRGRAALAQ